MVSFPGVLVGTSLILDSVECSLLSSCNTTVAFAAGGTNKFLLVNVSSTGSLERSLERAERSVLLCELELATSLERPRGI